MILDTNALSALAEQDPALLGILAPEPHLTLNLVSIAEFQFGIDGSSKRKTLQTWFRRVLEQSVLLKPGMGTVPEYSRIRHELKSAGTPIPANDIWIAAICREHHLPILSRDRDFDVVKGLKRVAW